jgi:prephenate dehydrogenase
MTTIAFLGAAGKMGARISRRLRDDASYRTLYVEAGDVGVRRLRERGDIPTAPDAAAGAADVIVLAVSDKLVGKVSKEIVSLLRSGAMMILLDPAATHGGELPERKDITYFVCHPCPLSTMRLTQRRAWISSAQSKPNYMWLPR